MRSMRALPSAPANSRRIKRRLRSFYLRSARLSQSPAVAWFSAVVDGGLLSDETFAFSAACVAKLLARQVSELCLKTLRSGLDVARRRLEKRSLSSVVRFPPLEMESAASSLVVDIGSAQTRVGFAGEPAPLQHYNSALGIRVLPAEPCSPTKRTVLFPLNFLARREGVEVLPALFPDWSNVGSDGDVLSLQPNYILQPEAFEALVALSCAGTRAAVCTRSFNAKDSNALKPLDCSTGSGLAEKRGGGEALRFGDSPVYLSELCGLGVDLREQPLLLTEPNVSCTKLREKQAEILFESLQLRSLYMAKRALLSCVAAGRGSALVVDAGASGVSLAPVADSTVLARRVVETPVGGDAMSLMLGEILRLHGLPTYPSFARFASVGRSAKRALDSPRDWQGVHASFLHARYATPTRRPRLPEASPGRVSVLGCC